MFVGGRLWECNGRISSLPVQTLGSAINSHLVLNGSQLESNLGALSISLPPSLPSSDFDLDVFYNIINHWPLPLSHILHVCMYMCICCIINCILYIEPCDTIIWLGPCCGVECLSFRFYRWLCPVWTLYHQLIGTAWRSQGTHSHTHNKVPFVFAWTVVPTYILHVYTHSHCTVLHSHTNMHTVTQSTCTLIQ